MLALSSPLFSGHGWPLEDPNLNLNDQTFLFSAIKSPESFFQFPPLPPPPELDLYQYSTPSPEAGSGDAMNLKTAKKLNHNASERDRRKKMNSLYSSLRSLLPSADQTKKLSNPSTVSRMLSYIPELQDQVERLVRKKEEILSAIAGQEIEVREKKNTKMAAVSSSSVVSANRLNEREMAVQISAGDSHRNSLSQILVCLEEDGLLLLNASSFQSLDGKIFHNLHLQEESNCKVEAEMLSNKLLQMFP